MEVDLIIRGCMVLPMVPDQIIGSGLIAVKDARICYVGEEEKAPDFEAKKEITGRGKIAMPGLINCHTHAAMSLFRGIAEDQELDKWLKETIWPLERKLKPQDIYHGALLSCLEMIKSGTTCFSDMYFHEDMVAKAVTESGLRAALASGIIDTGNRVLGWKLFRDATKFVKKYNHSADGRITARLGPHTVSTCSLGLLKKITGEASSLGVGMHIHLAESEKDSTSVRDRYGKSEVELIEEIGFLGPDVLAAHCVQLSNADIVVLAKRDVKVAYNPVANMKLASGIPKIIDLLDAGVTVGLGTDGPASNNSLDMFETMKFAALLQKMYYEDPTVMPARKILEMATVEGARALGLERVTGSLEAGKKADLILVNCEAPHLTPMHDPYASLVYSARGSDVETVIIDGRIIMESRKVETLEEGVVIEKGRETALNLLNR